MYSRFLRKESVLLHFLEQFIVADLHVENIAPHPEHSPVLWSAPLNLRDLDVFPHADEQYLLLGTKDTKFLPHRTHILAIG
jgi:hypothetical protein